MICAPFASALFVAYSSQIAHGLHCTFDAYFCFCTRLRRPSHGQRRAVLDAVKALAALDPSGFGLDDACAQLEGSTYVMAEEALLVFSIDPTARQPYREVLVGANTPPLRSRIRCGVLQPPLSEQRCRSFNNSLIDRATLLARSLRRLHVTRICCRRYARICAPRT